MLRHLTPCSSADLRLESASVFATKQGSSIALEVFQPRYFNQDITQQSANVS